MKKNPDNSGDINSSQDSDWADDLHPSSTVAREDDEKIAMDTLNFIDQKLFVDISTAECAPVKPRRRKKLNEETVTPHIVTKERKKTGRPPKSSKKYESTDMGPPTSTPGEPSALVKGPGKKVKASMVSGIKMETGAGTSGKGKHHKFNSGLTPDLAHLGILDPNSGGKLFSPNMFSPSLGRLEHPSPVRLTPLDAPYGRTPYKGIHGMVPIGFTPGYRHHHYYKCVRCVSIYSSGNS